jgi:uncharacterized protein (DUF488 family)
MSDLTAERDPSPIFTIGHGAGTFADLEARVGPHRIQTIVDVRSQPYSRHAPEFSKTELEAIAAEAGFGYRWLGDRLGGRPQGEALTTAGEVDPEKVVASASYRSGIEELLALADVSRVVLLCAELDHRHCHRATWIADTLERLGRTVRHIDGTGAAVAHQPGLGL